MGSSLYRIGRISGISKMRLPQGDRIDLPHEETN